MRYSLAFLLITATIASIAMATWNWFGILGLLIACGTIGLAVGIYSLFAKRWYRATLGFASLATVTLLLFIDAASTKMWSGHFTLEFDVTVVDFETKEPLHDAQVYVDPDRDPFVTDQQGRVTFSQSFSCGGADSVLGITQSSWESVSLEWYPLQVRTSDGLVQQFRLDQLVGQSTWQLGNSKLPPMKLLFDSRNEIDEETGE